MERSGTEVSSAPPTNPAGVRVGGAGVTIPQARGGAGSPAQKRAGDPDPQLVQVTPADRPVAALAGGDARGDARGDAGGDGGGRKRHRLGLVLIVVACCTVGVTIGASLAAADHQAAQQQARLVPLLDDAALAVQQVNSAGKPLDPARLVELLQRVQSTDAAVARATTGRSWLIARLITRRDSLDEATDRAQGLSLLADAAGPLRESLTVLPQPEASDPDQLDTLARDLNRFASVSLRAQQLGTYPAVNGSAGTPFEQLATAAAVLPTMAGSETARSWTICPTSTSPCYRFTVRAGRTVGRVTVVRSSTAAGGTRAAAAADIVVHGRAPRQLVRSGRLSVRAVLDTLVSTDSTDAGADDGSPVVTSAVPVEQHALDVIAGQGTPTSP